MFRRRLNQRSEAAGRHPIGADAHIEAIAPTLTRAKAAGSPAKRAVDIAAGAVGLALFTPFIALLAVATLAVHGRPILFRQARVGLGGRGFTMAKFRTMTNARGDSGDLLPDEQRMTGFGRFLRRFRLDELPSFIHVLTGDTSLVGPRPLPPYILETIPGSAARHCVRPGFTGLAQVSGNTLLTNEEKLALDLLYARDWTHRLDASILLKTVKTIIAGEERNEPLIGRAMEEQRAGSWTVEQ